MENKENLDELFRTKFNDLEAEPPFDSWPDIKGRLARKERKKRMAFWRYSSVAAAVLLAFFSGYFYQGWNTMPNRQLKETGRPDMVLPEQQKPQNTKPGFVNETTPSEEIAPAPKKSPENSGFSRSQRNIASESMKTKTPGNAVKAGSLTEGIAENTPVGTDHEEPILREDNSSVAFNASREENESAKRAAGKLQGFLTSPNSGNNNSEETNSDILVISPEEMKLLAEGHTTEKRKGYKRTSGIELSVLAGPTVPFMDVSVKDQNASTQNNIRNEQLENTYATGMKVLIRNDRNWEWQAGLMVNNWIQNSNNVLLSRPAPSSITSNPNNVTSSDVNGFTSLGNVSFTEDASKVVSPTGDLTQYYLVPNIGQEYQFVEVPIGAAYYLLNGRFEMKLQAGFNARILSHSNVYLEYPDGSTSDYDGLRPNDLSLQLSTGPGFAYRITPKLRFRLDPMVYYGVTPINRGNDVETYYHQLLFFSGISYRF